MATAEEGGAPKRPKTVASEDDGPAAMDEDGATKPQPSKLGNTGKQDMISLRGMYYQRLFPFKQFCRWLGYDNVDKDCLLRREMSFTLDGDIYIRYLSFKTAKDMEKDMIRRNPEKIDIGAIYNIPAADRMSVADGVFKPQEREFVIDIDLSDYNDVRTCCSAAGICTRCWPFMSIAVRVLDHSLRHDFGFQHIMWVYSGRRGVHCWVSDRRARLLSDEARSAVAEYLSAYVGGSGRQVNLTYPLHPSMRRAYDQVLKDSFENLCVGEQQILDGDTDRQRTIEENLLEMIPDPAVRDRIKELFSQQSNGWEKWGVLQAELKKVRTKVQNGKSGVSTSLRRTSNALEVKQIICPFLSLSLSLSLFEWRQSNAGRCWRAGHCLRAHVPAPRHRRLAPPQSLAEGALRHPPQDGARLHAHGACVRAAGAESPSLPWLW
jgi:predicted DNA primase small subunit